MPAGDATSWPEVLIWLGREARAGARVTLGPEESHHLVRVLRRGTGDDVVLADGAGGWIDARIVSASGRGAELEVRHVRRSPAEPACELELAFPILRPSRTEWLLEKATELGATRLVPLLTTRGRRRGERPERWRRIVRSASMQCLRSKPPEVIDPISFIEWCYEGRDDLATFVGVPGGRVPPASLPGPARLAVGPEGDLTPEEHAALETAGAAGVDLGPRRLRVETAAVLLVGLVARAQRAAIDGGGAV